MDDKLKKAVLGTLAAAEILTRVVSNIENPGYPTTLESQIQDLAVSHQQDKERSAEKSGTN